MFIEDGCEVFQAEDGDVIFADVFENFFEFGMGLRTVVVGDVLGGNGYNGVEDVVDIIFLFGAGDDHFAGFKE